LYLTNVTLSRNLSPTSVSRLFTIAYSQ